MTDKLYNADYLKHLCQKYGLKPSKKYGQNFLISAAPLETMLYAADVKKSDTVVEIGPGFGVLTFALAAKTKKVVAFEIEKKLASYWEENKPSNVEIVWGNFISATDAYISRISNYKVVANLPYQITSAVIRSFLETENQPESMTFMVQKEVAERICAKAGDMSLLSVAVQYYASPQITAIVPRDNFWPEPQVDSAIIHIEPVKKTENESDVEKFFKTVKAGFSSRRKLLIKNLESQAGMNKGKLVEIFTKFGLKPTVRAQELKVEEWKALSKGLKN